MNRISELFLNTTPPPPLEYLIGPVEASEFLHVGVDTIEFWAAAQLIPAHELRYEDRKVWRFRRSELAEWRRLNPDIASPKGRRKLATSKRKPSVAKKKRIAPPPNTNSTRKNS